MAKSRSDCPVLFSLSIFFSRSLSQSIAACLLGVPCYPRAAVAVPYVLLPLQYIPTKKFLLPCFVLAPLLLGLAGPSSNRPRAPHCYCAIAWTEYAIGAPALPGGARKGHLYHIALDGSPALSRRHRVIGQVWAQCDGQRNMWAETKKRKMQQGGKRPLVLYCTSGHASRCAYALRPIPTARSGIGVPAWCSALNVPCYGEMLFCEIDYGTYCTSTNSVSTALPIFSCDVGPDTPARGVLIDR
jgi:hypothetical protein